LCRQQAKVIKNYDKESALSIGQGEATYGKYKRLKLGGGQPYNLSRD
jgi:hypothetical protein